MNIVLPFREIAITQSSMMIENNSSHNRFTVKRLERFLDKARCKRKKAQNVTEKIQNYEAEIIRLTQKIEKRNIYHKYAEKCALKIQKCFRGYLVRNRYSEVKIT